MANLKTIKVTCTAANTAYNVVTGTTVAPAVARDNTLVGQEVTIQNQTSGSVLTVGGSDVVSNGGIQVLYRGAYSLGNLTSTFSGIQLQEFWVSSDTAGAVGIVQLRKAV